MGREGHPELRPSAALLSDNDEKGLDSGCVTSPSLCRVPSVNNILLVNLFIGVVEAKGYGVASWRLWFLDIVGMPLVVALCVAILSDRGWVDLPMVSCVHCSNVVVTAYSAKWWLDRAVDSKSLCPYLLSRAIQARGNF